MRIRRSIAPGMLLASCLSLSAALARADVWVSSYFQYDPTTQAVGALLDYSNSGTLLGSYDNANLLQYATGVVAGPNNMLYLTSPGTLSVVQFNPATDAFSNFAVGSPATGPQYPTSPVVGPDGNLYVADAGSNNVYAYSFSNPSTPTIIPGVPSGDYVGSIAFSPSGALTVGDNSTGAIYNLPSTGTSATPSYAAPSPATQLGEAGNTIVYPSGLLWHGNDLYISQLGGNGVNQSPNSGPGQILELSYGSSLSNVPTATTLALAVPPQQGADSSYDASASPAGMIPDGTGKGFYLAFFGPSDYYPEGGVMDVTYGLTSTSYFIAPYPNGAGIFAPGGLAITPVPEPSSWALLCMGLIALALCAGIDRGGERLPSIESAGKPTECFRRRERWKRVRYRFLDKAPSAVAFSSVVASLGDA